MKQKLINLWPLGFILLAAFLAFHPIFLKGYLPIPYNILVGWYFPYQLGGWEGYAPGIPFKGGLFAADVFRQIIPWKMLSLDLIKSGQLPLWNPYNFSGEPLFANPQVFTLYPLTLIFFLFDFHIAWSLYIIASPFLAACFMFLFLRSLKLTQFPALLGSLSFAFSGHMLSWLEWGVVTHSGIWLPLILFSLNLWLKNNHRLGPVLLMFSVFATITAGYPQESVYALLLAAAYYLFLFFSLNKKLRHRTILHTLFVGLIIFTLLLPQLLSTFQLFQLSALKGIASEALFLRTRLDPRHLITFFAPDYFGNRIYDNYWANIFTLVDYTDANLYIGSIAGLFALFGLIKSRTKNSWFFSIALLVSLLLSINSPLTYLLGHLRLPLISTGVAAGILYLSVFSLSALSAFGLNYWLHQPSKSKAIFKLLAVYCLILVSSLFVPSDFQKITLKALLVPMSLVFLTLFSLFVTHKFLRRYLYLLPLFLLLISCLDYGYQARRLLSFSPRSYAYPDQILINQLQQLSGYDRVMGFWEAEISNSLHTQFRLFGSEGYNPLHSMSYQELTAASHTGDYPATIARSDADVTVANEPNRNRFIDLASVKYIPAVVTTPTNTWEEEPLKFDPKRFQLVWQEGLFKIYQNLNALPRVGIYNNFQVITDKSQRLQTLYSPDFDPHRSLILEEQPFQLIHSQATGSAKIVTYEPNRVVIDTQTSVGNSLLLLTDNYYPSWQATIDGLPTRIYKANHTFRSVLIPQGNHQVEFTITWP